MSVIIKGMPMPKNCGECGIAAWDSDDGCYRCPFSEAIILSIGRHNDCPLIEVPPHGRLIDADALVDELIKRSRTNPMPLLGQMVDFAPTIIESEEKDG